MVDMDEATLSPMVVPLCGTMVALCAMVVAFGDDGRRFASGLVQLENINK